MLEKGLEKSPNHYTSTHTKHGFISHECKLIIPGFTILNNNALSQNRLGSLVIFLTNYVNIFFFKRCLSVSIEIFIPVFKLKKREASTQWED